MRHVTLFIINILCLSIIIQISKRFFSKDHPVSRMYPLCRCTTLNPLFFSFFPKIDASLNSWVSRIQAKSLITAFYITFTIVLRMKYGRGYSSSLFAGFFFFFPQSIYRFSGVSFDIPSSNMNARISVTKNIEMNFNACTYLGIIN